MFKAVASAAAALSLAFVPSVGEAKTAARTAHPHASHAPHARLTMAQARAIALRAAPGKVISSEYENEGGGWRYSFDIQQHNNVQEIGVNPLTGKIIENKSEGRHDRD